PYVPAYKSELSATGTLKDLEKIYVGRSYDPSVDPFPEYNYDYSESKSSHSINLEQPADRPNNDLFSLASDDSFSFNLAPTPLTPWPGSRRRKTYSGMDDEKEVARELALSGSFFNLPIDNTFGPRDILKDITTTARNKVKRSTLIVTSSLFSLDYGRHAGVGAAGTRTPFYCHHCSDVPLDGVFDSTPGTSYF
ncbi:hypothetical protein EST38_g5490, partial [Candolleomyces aberdarensis]